MGPLLRAAVLCAMLLALTATAEAHSSLKDILNIFKPRSEKDYFHNAFEGQQEQTIPRSSDEPQLDTVPVPGGHDLMKVPMGSPPTPAVLDTIVLPVDKAAEFAGAWSMISENSGVSAMHMVIMRHDKAIMFDTVTSISGARSPAPRTARRTPLSLITTPARSGPSRSVSLFHLYVRLGCWWFPYSEQCHDDCFSLAADHNGPMLLVRRPRRGRQPGADRRLLRRREGCAVP
jgi:hypothetical protein